MSDASEIPAKAPYPPFLLRVGLNAAGMSQRSLARKMGWAETYVSRLARGQATPSWRTACAIAEAIGVSLDLFREVPMPSAQIGPLPEEQPRRRRRKKEQPQ